MITWVELQLQPIESSFMEIEEIGFSDLREFYPLLQATSMAWPYRVAWVDCAGGTKTRGRGIYSKGRHSSNGEFEAHGGWEPRIPLELPVLNKMTSRALNAIYYAVNKRKSSGRRMHLTSFFYPLDRIHGWNRLYGRAGMFQYQLVVPSIDAEHESPNVFAKQHSPGKSLF